jgi:hypothetical protein
MSVVAASPAGPHSVHLEVGVTFANDNDLAPDATVTATLTNADGATVGPVDLPNGRGAHYGADITVPAPGTWTFIATAINPAATATGTVDVGDAPTTTPLPTSTTTTTMPPTIAASPTMAEPPPAGPEGAWSGPARLLVGIAALLTAAAAAVVVFARRRPDGKRGADGGEGS